MRGEYEWMPANAEAQKTTVMRAAAAPGSNREDGALIGDSLYTRSA
jgi:hypothetical protein